MTDKWIIEGVGICVDRVKPYLNPKKVLAVMLNHNPHNGELQELSHGREEELDIDGWCDGLPGHYDNLADLFCFCDTTDTLHQATDEDGAAYLFYPPCMPWHCRAEDPKSIEECRMNIISAIITLVDMDTSDIEELIDNELLVICES